jgi:hypothetical protein
MAVMWGLVGKAVLLTLHRVVDVGFLLQLAVFGPLYDCDDSMKRVDVSGDVSGRAEDADSGALEGVDISAVDRVDISASDRIGRVGGIENANVRVEGVVNRGERDEANISGETGEDNIGTSEDDLSADHRSREQTILFNSIQSGRNGGSKGSGSKGSGFSSSNSGGSSGSGGSISIREQLVPQKQQLEKQRLQNLHPLHTLPRSQDQRLQKQRLKKLHPLHTLPRSQDQRLRKQRLQNLHPLHTLSRSQDQRLQKQRLKKLHPLHTLPRFWISLASVLLSSLLIGCTLARHRAHYRDGLPHGWRAYTKKFRLLTTRFVI